MSKLTQQDLLDFEQAQTALKKAKKVELELRNKIINNFRYGKAIEGVQHKSLEGSEIDIVVTLGLTRTIDKEALEAIWTDLDPDQREAISYVPKLDTKLFKDLVKNDEAGELVNAIIEKPSQASLVLKE